MVNFDPCREPVSVILKGGTNKILKNSFLKNKEEKQANKQTDYRLNRSKIINRILSY